MDDDDDDMGMDALSAAPSRAISTTTAWKTPSLLPARADAPPPQVNSPEVATQTARMTNILRAQYISEYNVPSSPAPMSDVEQALDMTNQSSTVTQSIPFFVPQQLPEPVPAAPVPAPAVSYPPPANNWAAPPQPVVRPMESPPSAATPDFVQSLGLPMFLVGQDIQALQTLASTPSLLSTFVDSNGMYDQARLTSLVQTLSQNSKPKPQPQPVATGHMGAGGYQQPYQGGQNRYGGAPPGGGGIYGPASGGAYGPSSGSGAYGGGWQAGGPPKNGFREQKSSDGNLHVSGYGPATTQVDIINVFAPYVQVDEVVMKGTFSFVNTSDPPGAARAREALTGALIGGQPIRINVATRKKREDGPPPFGGAPPMASVYGGAGQSVPGLPSQPPPMMNQGGFPPPVAPPGNVDVNSVRDDRGNPATKNLFVAGYGPGTTEFQLRELFGQHAQILAIIVKGTFCFVNTSDRVDAVRARECLSGSMFNGGVLRINFAKESGRLGTSFDVTYNQAGGGGPGGHGGPGPPPGGGLSHYGRR
jgi:RNA recognition motif-containing protein